MMDGRDAADPHRYSRRKNRRSQVHHRYGLVIVPPFLFGRDKRKNNKSCHSKNEITCFNTDENRFNLGISLLNNGINSAGKNDGV